VASNCPDLRCGLPLVLLGKTAVGESLVIGVPLVAISMGIETAFLDALLFRMLLKASAKKRFVSLLIANVLNASIALTLGLAWAFHDLPTFVANADSWGGKAITLRTGHERNRDLRPVTRWLRARLCFWGGQSA
jgi:hypothetical protein